MFHMSGFKKVWKNDKAIIGKGVGKQILSYTTDGSINWCSISNRQLIPFDTRIPFYQLTLMK